MGDCPLAGKLSHYVTSHPGQLSLAIPPWVDPMSTGNGYGLGGRVVRTLDLRSLGREFESRPLRYRVQPWASC